LGPDPEIASPSDVSTNASLALDGPEGVPAPTDELVIDLVRARDVVEL
jgi:hypothetical protein